MAKSIPEIQKREPLVSRRVSAEHRLRESGKASLVLQLKHFEDACANPTWGKKMLSNVLYLVVRAFLLEVLIPYLSYRNQGLLIDDPLKTATRSHMCQLCVSSDDNNS